MNFIFSWSLTKLTIEPVLNCRQSEANNQLPKKEPKKYSTLSFFIAESKEYSFSRAHARPKALYIGLSTYFSMIILTNPWRKKWILTNPWRIILTNPWRKKWILTNPWRMILTNPWRKIVFWLIRGAVVKICKLFGRSKIKSYLCKWFRDDSSFYPARASVTAQPMARAFLMAKSQRVLTRDICGILVKPNYSGCHLVD